MSIYEDRLRGLAASAVTAAPKPWDPQLHPRARDGKFIKVGGWVRGLFRIGNGDYEKLNGRVLGVEKNPRYPKDPLVRVATKHGDITAPVSQISAALEPKGTLAKIVSVLPGVHITEDPPEIVAYKASPLDGDKTFLSGVPLEGADLNGIPLTEVDFDPSSIPDVDVGEPPLPEPVMPSWVKDPEKWKPTKMRQSAGVMIEEPDGRVWLYEPQNRFGGYNFTFSKGGVEDGDTMQQAAMREAFEELGLVTEITGYIGDYKGSTTMTRLYRGKRVGGAPWKHDNEVAEVRLVAPETAASLLNMLRDQQILADFTGDDTYLEAFKERAAAKAAERAAKKAAEDAARAAAKAASKEIRGGDPSKAAALSLTEKYMKAGKKPSARLVFRTGSDYQGSAQQGQMDGWVQADVDGTAAATLDYSIVSDEPDTLYIDMIEVLPKYQGRGLGKQMLDKVIADQWTQWGEDPPTIEPGMLTDAGMQWWQTVESDPKYKTGTGSSLSESLGETPPPPPASQPMVKRRGLLPIELLRPSQPYLSDRPAGAQKKLEDDVAEVGILTPLEVQYDTVQGTTGYWIVQGHHRYEAAKKAGLTHVPVVVESTIGEPPDLLVDDRE